MRKVGEGRPSIVDRIIDGDVHFVVNTTGGKQEISDSYSIRRETLMKRRPVLHDPDRGAGGGGGDGGCPERGPDVRSLQEYHADGR